MGQLTGVRRLSNERGVTMVVVALFMFVFIGFLALAVDTGFLYVIKGELQTAADAGARAGASALGQDFSPTPDWAAAQRIATAAVQQNSTLSLDKDTTKLNDADVIGGYWNLKQNPAGMQSQSITPTEDDVRAIRVTVSRDAANNGGPVPTIFARALGIDSVSLSASSIAAVGPVSTMAGGLFPVAIKKSFAEENRPVGGQSSQITLTPDTETVSKWTTLQEGNGADVTSKLTDPDYTLEVPISVGAIINNSSGDKTSLYVDIDKHAGTNVFFPVVDDFSNNKVVGFIAFHIVSAKGGNDKDIIGYFVGVTTNFGSGLGGGGYGLVSHSTLVK